MKPDDPRWPPDDPNTDPVVADSAQLGCWALLLVPVVADSTQFGWVLFLLTHEEFQLTTDAVVVTVGALNALSSSASAEYLSAETGGGPPLTGGRAPPRDGPITLLAPAGIVDGPELGIWLLANASKFANPAAVSATCSSRYYYN